MKSRTKKKLACGMLLAVGLGLVIGGAFFPPLLTAGVPILSTSLALFTYLMKSSGEEPLAPVPATPKKDDAFTQFKHFVVEENSKVIAKVSVLIVQFSLLIKPKDPPHMTHQFIKDKKPVLFRSASLKHRNEKVENEPEASSLRAGFD